MVQFYKIAQVDYKDHQKFIADELRNKRGLLLYWGLGSGKTLGAIGATKEYPEVNVITPASLQDNFLKEIKKAAPAGQYKIKSYEKFLRDNEDLTNDVVIIDEAHKLKNIDAKRTRALLDKTKSAKKLLLLSGTPIQNKAEEIAPLINMISGLPTLPTGKEFNKTFLFNKTHNPGFFESLFIGAPSYTTLEPKNLNLFKNKVKGLVSYYQPEQSIEDFPTVNENIINLPMSHRQIDLYNLVEKKLPSGLKFKIQNSLPPEKQEQANLNAFLSGARQISNTSKSFSKYHIDESPKLDLIARKVKSIEGPQVIYSNYLSSGIKPLSERLDMENIPYGIFTGEQTKKQKHELVDSYNTGNIKALLISSSGGEGLDLKNTSAVHIMEPHWNDPKIQQVIGRAARYKSHSALPEDKRKVDVYRYVSTLPDQSSFIRNIFGVSPKHHTSADEYLMNLSKKKEELNNYFLNALKEVSIEND